ncbi:MAG: BrnA antitoxin family protein [Pseudomonadota bacterium]
MASSKTDDKPLSAWARKQIEAMSDEEDRRITEAALSDPDNPPLTDEYFKDARPASEVDPDLIGHYRRVRGKQRAPTKERVTLRLDPEIVAHFRSGGKGWQSRINETLRKALKLDLRAS